MAWQRWAACPTSLPLLVGALLGAAVAVGAFQPPAGRDVVCHPISGKIRHRHKQHKRSVLLNSIELPISGKIRHRHKQHKRSVLLLAAYDDEDDDEEDDDDDDDIELTDSATANFVPPPTYTFGLNSGRSAPSQRLAMGKSSKDAAFVFVCSNCGSEFIQWVGRCPTCREYNTIQEMKVGRRSSIGVGDIGSSGRGSSSRPPRPVFGGGAGGDADFDGGGGGGLVDDDDFVGSGTNRKSRSAKTSYGGGGGRSWIDGMGGAPVPVTQVYEAMGTTGTRGGDISSSSSSPWSVDEDRLVIPDDDEFNTVLGGGIMPGSLILLGGDPGVGKSSLILQTAGALAALSSPPRGIGMGSSSDNAVRGGQGPVVYVSGEESTTQVASRAARLGIESTELLLVSDNDADRIAETVVGYFDRAYYDQEGESRGIFPPCLLVIDSIQTMTCLDGGNTSPGGVSQVRAVANLFLRLSKSLSLPIVLVGHVTKDGQIAGPRTVEHMVDAVLYLEGSGRGDGEAESIRILRAAKNRFGSASEVGVYQMSTGGGMGGGGRLIPVTDPSSLFLSTRMDDQDVVGCAVSVVLEGVRPMTVEVQALASDATGGPGSYGRRVVDGINISRLLLLLAVLQKRYNIRLSRKDVYVNVVSGLSLGEKGFGRNRQASDLDLSVAVSLVSSLTDIPVRSDTAFVGEVGLLGELRQVSAVEKRAKEAQRLGFSRVIIPSNRRPSGNRKAGWRDYKRRQMSSETAANNSYGIEVIECQTLMDAINEGLVSKFKFKSRKKRDNGSSTPAPSQIGTGRAPFGSGKAAAAGMSKKPGWRDVEELLGSDDERRDYGDDDDDDGGNGDDAFL